MLDNAQLFFIIDYMVVKEYKAGSRTITDGKHVGHSKIKKRSTKVYVFLSPSFRTV